METWRLPGSLSNVRFWDDGPKSCEVRRLKQDLGIDTTPEIFKLPTERDWDMLSVWI